MDATELIVRIHLTDQTATLSNGSVLSMSDLSVGDTIEITEILQSQNLVKGKLIRDNKNKTNSTTNDTTSQSTSTSTKPPTSTTPTERPDNKKRELSTSSNVRASLPDDTKKNGWLSVRPVSNIEDTKSRDRTFTTRAKESNEPAPPTSRSFFSSKSATNIQGLAAQSSPSLKKETIRVFFKDGSFKTVAIIAETTSEEVIDRITKRIPSIGLNQHAASHFVITEVGPDGSSRVLKAKDKLAAVRAAWKDKNQYKFVLGLHPRTIRRLSVQISKGQDISEVFREEKSKTDSFLDESDDGLDVLLKSLRDHAQKKQEDEKKAQQNSAWVRTSATERTNSRLVLGRGTETQDAEANDQQNGSSPTDASPASQADRDVDEPDNEEPDDFTETLYSPMQWFENEITSLSELVQSLPDNVLQNMQ